MPCLPEQDQKRGKARGDRTAGEAGFCRVQNSTFVFHNYDVHHYFPIN